MAEYAHDLAKWKRYQRQRELEQRKAEEKLETEELAELTDRGFSTDPDNYDDVPANGAYITVKETKSGYQYYYW